MTYIDSNGRRVTVQSAYFTPDVLKRPNLKISIKTSVTRILFEQESGKTRAVGVEFANAQDKPRYRAYAAKEVILACVITVLLDVRKLKITYFKCWCHPYAAGKFLLFLPSTTAQ